MATPHADRLHKMEAWRTSAMEDSHRHLTAVSQALVEIAAGNREVAADLGLEGATGQAARASFDRLARRMIKASDRLKQIVKASTEALTAGIDARNESIEIQTKLKTVNENLEQLGRANATAQGVPSAGVTAAEIEAKRQAAHAKIDALAKKSLSKLNGRILAAIDTLPPDGRTGQTTAHAGSRDTRPGNERVGDGPAAGQNTGPARSATAWAASVDTSLGTPGHHAPDGGHGPAAGGSGPTSGGGPAAGPIGGGVSLQGSHYAPPASGATAPSNPSVGAAGHSPAVFNPLASAAAVGGGAAVAGYRAYQAARPVQTPAYRPSAVRAAGAAPTPSARSAGIVRGATTAARTPTTSASGGRGTVRGGATGIARPAPTNNTTRSSGILRGTTTAARTPTASSTVSGRSSGILRGATTAVRKPTTAAASAGQPGGRTPARGTGSGSAARILTGGRTPTTSSSQSTGSSQKTGTSSRRAGSSSGGAAARSASTGARPSQPGTGQAGVRGGSASRALHNLTGRPDKNKKARRHRNDEPTQSIVPYEDDKTVTFLPAGHIDNTNPQPR